ncbi:MAG TPA: amidohydrolase family protein [Mycobacteriales bacterium]|nr:amidohydrolase family protein [Mycobacteriales bacterium]
MNLLITRAEIAGRRNDVRLAGQHVVEIGPRLRPAPHEETVDAEGGALLPGLHDHHLHLLALAAADRSVDLSLVDTRSNRVDAVLHDHDRRLPRGAWLRVIGYHERIAGPLDRAALDRLLPDRPLRVQHRSGGLWSLNSAGLARLGICDDTEDPAVERDPAGRVTGRLWRGDHLLRADAPTLPDLAPVSEQLAAHGITGVTDATPDLDTRALAHLTDAVRTARLRQRLHLLGAPLDAEAPPVEGVSVGPYKIVVDNHELPPYDGLLSQVRRARSAGRAVALHCVTLEALALILAVLEEAGRWPGDRIEHAAVAPPLLLERLASLRVAVVTQPGFVAERGDDYLRDVAIADQPFLYPYASALAAGVRVAPASDAPYASVDPWRTIRAAAGRQSTDGTVLGPGERVPAGQALAGYLSAADDPGGKPRTVALGTAADLCLLQVPLREALRRPDTSHVRMTLAGGEPVWRRD